MALLEETLARMGLHELSLMLGSDTVTLLELLDMGSIRTSSLAGFVINQIGPEDILFDRERRTAVIESLSQEDADRLVRFLQLPEDEDPWSVLTNQNFIRGSHSTNVLFSFLGHPLEEDDGELPNTLDQTTITPFYGLFDHQIKACREAIRLLSEGSRPRVMLHMPTGAGKTRTAMNIIAHFFRELLNTNQVVLWLAHSEELCEQAAKEFESAWSILGNRDLPLHRCYGDHSANFDDFQSGIVIGGLQLLYRRSINDQSAFLRFARRVPFVVMDEAHQAIAPSYKHLLNVLAADPSTAILGLSATPGRQTLDASEDVQLAEFFNRQKVTLSIEGYNSPIDYLQDEGYLAKVNYEFLPFHPHRDFVLSPDEIEKLQQGLDLPDSVVRRLGEDHARNFLIINRLIEAAQQGHKIVVLHSFSRSRAVSAPYGF